MANLFVTLAVNLDSLCTIALQKLQMINLEGMEFIQKS